MIKSFLTHVLPHLTLIGVLLKKPLYLMAIVPTVAVTTLVVDFYGMAWILFFFFVGDFASGLGASYCDWKKSDHSDKWFFGKGEGFSSDRAKAMGVKAIIYLSVPQLLLSFQEVMHLKNIRYEAVSDAEINVATISLIVFILIEGFSIFHENLPRCGFNLWHNIKKMIGFYKEVKKEIKTE